MKLRSAIIGAVLALASGAAFAAEAPEPVQVMVLGTWHFDNPGRDLNNMKSDDVLVPRRQAELEAVAASLATFRPTKIMVERLAKTPDLYDPAFASFTPAMLKTDRDERVQVAYRLAHKLSLGRVYAIDEQPGEGEPDYFPYDKLSEYAAAHGQAAELQSAQERVGAQLEAWSATQAGKGLADLLAEANAPDYIGGNDFYYGTLSIGDTEKQPGAELNAMWYMRNAKIFAKLMTAAKPGDRIVVVYGAGHNYWLRHFASETPGYANVDPAPYLKAAAAK